MSRTEQILNKRSAFVLAFLSLWMVAIGCKLVYLQFFQHEELIALADDQQRRDIQLSPDRGLIFDRHGNELARSVKAQSLYVSTKEVTDPSAYAKKLAALLKIDRGDLYTRLTAKKDALVVVKRKLTDEEVERVRANWLQGLKFIPEMKRFYIEGKTAAHTLGFVDFDEKGRAGIELAYDDLICGKGGQLSLNVDANRDPYHYTVEDATSGANVTLTLDLTIQHHVEKVLEQAVRANRARAGTIVVMRPSTGEILALANYPTYNPNSVRDSEEEQRRNRAVEVAFEPGSIFKLVTYAAGIEEREITPQTLLNCGNGKITIFGREVKDSHAYGTLSASTAFAKSSNVGAIRVGMKLGNARLGQYIEAFGFGKRTEIELPGESRGLYRPPDQWQATTIGSIPMGHEIGVTAVQAVAAFACIANDGEWVQPYIVKNVTANTGEVLVQRQPLKRQVVSASTAAALKSMLEGVVVNGTGKQAQIGGYRAAGKTGTAQKINPNTRAYSNNKFVASFAGFAPAEQPEIACLVSIDEPMAAHLGGDVAAPVFARVVAQALTVLGVHPQGEDVSTFRAGSVKAYSIAPLTPESGREAERLTASNVEPENPPAVVRPSNEKANPASKSDAKIMMPNLSGKNLREATALCNARGIQLRAHGEGIITAQSLRAGLLVTKASLCSVTLTKQSAGKTKPDRASKSPTAKGQNRPTQKR